MKKIYILLFLQSLIFNLESSFGQGGTWTWISGDSTQDLTGAYGTLGVPSVNYHPPGLYEPVEWKDKQGNFWIYGGSNTEPYSDLWKYNPATNEWTWVKGTGLPRQKTIGTKGVSNAANTPGLRWFCAPSWVDTSGNLWLFSGLSSGSDLWKYTISTNEWTWVKGDTTSYAKGFYGTKGVPSLANNPGSRGETCSAWTDSSNNLWLFGGAGEDANGGFGPLNDVWKYDISTNEWTWMKGSAYVNAAANYGKKGIADTLNDPGARQTYTKWKDLQNNFWLMGGVDDDGALSDVWKYDYKINQWTWMSGPDWTDDEGNYVSKCVFDTINEPYSRWEQRSAATDNCGRFWLFGGVSHSVELNDLWVFDPVELKWNWLSGNQKAYYGQQGVASSFNMPPSRNGAVAWWGNDNKFYMFTGVIFVSDLWVYNPDTNCVSSSCTSVAVVPPVANFQSNVTTFCANNCINFTNQSTNATSYQWFFPGAIDSTSTDQNPQSICYIKSGAYSVTLIASNAGGSDTVIFSNYINVSPAPPTPVIIQHHDTLYCTTDTSYISYQWYLDSTIITRATDTLLVVSKNGNYNLRITNSSGCSIAVGITVITGIQNYMNDNIISLWPNPATDQLTVSGNWKDGAGMKLTIINVLGETIYKDEINRKQETVNCKPLSSGIYFIEVTNQTGRWTGRFIKQ